MPQIQADPADAPKQTIDPSNQGTSSAVVREQTTIASPQGKISIIKSLPMNFYTDTIIILSICSRRCSIGRPNRSGHNTSHILKPKARDCSETSKPADLLDFVLSVFNPD